MGTGECDGGEWGVDSRRELRERGQGVEREWGESPHKVISKKVGTYDCDGLTDAQSYRGTNVTALCK